LGPRAGLGLATRYGAGAERSRRLIRMGLEDVRHAWLDREGTSLDLDVLLPLGQRFALGARTSLFLEDAGALSTWGFGAYRHQCGCLGLSLGVGQRVGRDGFDASLSLDLVEP
jgi:hypothetical protein